MNFSPGDIYWVPLEESSGIVHPHVVIQEDALNSDRVVIVTLTTNIKWISLPGNVLLEIGEANLPKQSIVSVSQISIVPKTQLGEYIGSLSKARVDQILAGMRFVQRMTAHH
ncbi:MAG: type II toxin-antitoxin system PemK/MazF family toxin [Anaerolineales bacterium]